MGVKLLFFTSSKVSFNLKCDSLKTLINDIGMINRSLDHGDTVTVGNDKGQETRNRIQTLS